MVLLAASLLYVLVSGSVVSLIGSSFNALPSSRAQNVTSKMSGHISLVVILERNCTGVITNNIQLHRNKHKRERMEKISNSLDKYTKPNFANKFCCLHVENKMQCERHIAFNSIKLCTWSSHDTRR